MIEVGPGPGGITRAVLSKAILSKLIFFISYINLIMFSGIYFLNFFT